MSRLIIFSDYLKASDKTHILNTLDYISNRDGVVFNENNLLESLTNLRTLNEKTKKYGITEAQETFIKKMIESNPDLAELNEYNIYIQNQNMYTASVFIREGVEMLQEMALTNEIYMKYISERPGVDKNINDSTHGLFDQSGFADRDNYYKELEGHKGNIYRDIISLRLEDSIELEYDNQAAWITLLQTKMIDKANLIGIPLQDFRWCAAFHNEGHHPHSHVMYWDAKGSRGFQEAKDIKSFKSALTNEIFKEEIWLKKELKTEFRQDLETEFHKRIHDLNKDVLQSLNKEDVTELKQELIFLSKILNNGGSKNYGYQNLQAKMQTNKIVSNLLCSSSLEKHFERYLASQLELASFYFDAEGENSSKYIADFQKKMFIPEKGDRKVLHNYVVRAAYEISQNELKQSLLTSSSLSKIDNALIEPSIKAEEATQKDLITLAKIDLLRACTTDEVHTRLAYFEQSEEKRCDIILEAKDNTKIQEKEIYSLNKLLGIKLDTAVHYNKLVEVNNVVNTHAAGKLIQQFCNMLSTGTVSNARELARIQKVRREDEYMIRKNQFNK